MPEKIIGILFTVIFFLSGCGAGGSGTDDGDGNASPDQADAYIYIAPQNQQLSVSDSIAFTSSIRWNNAGEQTQSVTWSGSGAGFLNDSKQLNPVFSATRAGRFELTQTITSSEGRTAVASIVIEVADNPVTVPYHFTAPDDQRLKVSESVTFRSAINWNNGGEQTRSVIWSGQGVSYLNNTRRLNPTFSAVLAGTYHLTQTIESSSGQKIETRVQIVVTDNDDKSVSDIQAMRLLQQATFGPSMQAIEKVKSLGIEGWIDDQISKPAGYHLPLLASDKRQKKFRWEAWFKTATYGEDQLRQRMAFALSEILTISINGGKALRYNPRGMTHYYDVLVEHALGNYRDLLERVSKHPVMAIYLTYLGNHKGDGTQRLRPDENYARELMQLFTIGLVMLNEDGTPKRDSNGNTIATYNQQTIEEFAKIFTGWCRIVDGDYTKPLATCEQAHSPGEKRLLVWGDEGSAERMQSEQNSIVPAGQTTEQDLQSALDNLMSHPNMAPFISKQLIQRLVTSNPSAAYVKRVAQVFKATHGDLAAVAKAILIDSEARYGDDSSSFGKLREPLIMMTHLWRALPAPTPAKVIRLGNHVSNQVGQAPLDAPSVFSFFSPDFTTTTLQANGLVGPEFQINTTSQLIRFANFMEAIIFKPHGSPVVDMSSLIALYNEEDGTEKLIERIDLLFTNGKMSDHLKEKIAYIIQDKQANELIRGAPPGLQNIMSQVIAFVMLSPDFVIQR